MKTKKPDDSDRNIAKRKEADAECAAYDSEKADWEIDRLLAKAREGAGLPLFTSPKTN
jgi:hypothetical protein